QPPHARHLGDDKKDYSLGLPATGQPDTRTASTSGAAK
ncbi:MAG TPA: NADH-quinone oxidoreductase subunit I, partial [Arachnia sp.]|nr:NADH-quinone oxidoreductase subunit I [Arachnia sp.]